MLGALGGWVKDGQLSLQQVRDGFEAEGVDVGALEARFARLLGDKDRSKPAAAARGK
jgi:hypothetical protein